MPRAAVALTRYTCNAAPTGTVRMAAVVLSALFAPGARLRCESRRLGVG
jgi:hypothetical protein